MVDEKKEYGFYKEILKLPEVIGFDNVAHKCNIVYLHIKCTLKRQNIV